jgi:hypothetical protein
MYADMQVLLDISSLKRSIRSRAEKKKKLEDLQKERDEKKSSRKK